MAFGARPRRAAMRWEGYRGAPLDDYSRFLAIARRLSCQPIVRRMSRRSSLYLVATIDATRLGAGARLVGTSPAPS